MCHRQTDKLSIYIVILSLQFTLFTDFSINSKVIVILIEIRRYVANLHYKL